LELSGEFTRALSFKSKALSLSAVTAALQAGVAAASEVGNVKVSEVIARPHPDVMRFLTTG
jgi:microcompartment protein CcmL/EutN